MSSRKLYSLSSPLESAGLEELPISIPLIERLPLTWRFLLASAFLVSIPVFFQAPLVRSAPWLSLVMTGGWFWLSAWLRSRPRSAEWGDLLMGFTWTWLAGSIYWGWLRWEPLLHLPVESVGLPFAIAGLRRGQDRIGNWFYLGSLFGTAMTDAYFYAVNLIPQWRQLVQVEPHLMEPIFQSAIAQMQTPWGISWAIGLGSVLLLVGGLPLRSQQLHWWTLGGAVLSTILVDGLFWLAAISVL